MRRHAPLGLAQLDHLVAHAVARAEDHQLAQVDVLDADVRALVERIVGRDVGEEPVAEELLLGDALAARAPGHERRVDAVAPQRLHDVGGHHLRNLQLHLRIVAHESRQELVQQVGRDGGDHPQPQAPRGLAPQLGHGLADGVVGAQRLARTFEHRLARLGGDHGFLRTVKQHHAQLLLQGLDLHAERRLRDEAVLCGQ